MRLLRITLLSAGLALLAGGPLSCKRRKEGSSAAAEGVAARDKLPKMLHGILTRGAELGQWTHDFEAAVELATAKKLPLFLNFTASDYSPPCRQMAEAVFAKPEWLAYATTHLVLVAVDFPMDETRVPAVYRQRNERLAQRWVVESYPTFLILDSGAEQELARLGVIQKPTPQTFIAKVKDALARKAKDKPAPVKLQPVEIAGASAAQLEFMLTGAAPAKWTQDLEAAVALAQKTGQPILLNFTGSDWCGACQSMNMFVFNKASWQRYAKRRLVLVVLDYPRKRKLPLKIAERNRKLAENYGIAAFPTFVLLEPDGKTIIGRAPPAFSPHEFRVSLEQAARFQKSAIAVKTKEIGGKTGERYGKLMAELYSARREVEKLEGQAQELYMQGSLSAEFISQVKETADKAAKLNLEVADLEHRHYAAKLGPAAAAKYLKLQAQLRRAEAALDTWMATSPANTPENKKQFFQQQNSIRTIKAAIEDIEAAHFLKSLPAAAAGGYKKLLQEFRDIQGRYHRWLRTDPPDTPANTKLYREFYDSINRLTDELDAIRDRE